MKDVEILDVKRFLTALQSLSRLRMCNDPRVPRNKEEEQEREREEKWKKREGKI